MTIAIANDHHGVKMKYDFKNYLEHKGYDVIDLGVDSQEPVDYPELAFKCAEKVCNKEVDFGILLCGTGVGMSIAANKVKGIRCAKLDTLRDAYYTRFHNNANMAAFSTEMGVYRSRDILDMFVKTKFSNEERHIRRNEMVDSFDN
ncbi:MAG: RpiB/LacA/LacB family sugar-phosphate isomerase [Bacilli bacterium]